MVFLLFSLELVLFLAGISGLFFYETTFQLYIFLSLLIISILLFALTVYYYQRKKGKKSKSTNDCWDWPFYMPDCLPSSGAGKKSLDCDSFDCGPDCTP